MAHKAVIAHFHKACGQYVLKKTAHKFHDIQGHGAPPVAVRFSVTEPHRAIFNLDDAAVRDGHLEYVRRQIPDRLLAVAHSLTVDNEVLLPHVWINILQQADTLELIPKFGFEDR